MCRSQQKIRERVKLLTRFIRTAEELRDLGNYHLLQAFIAGFSNSAVARLQWTKARLPKVRFAFSRAKKI